MKSSFYCLVLLPLASSGVSAFPKLAPKDVLHMTESQAEEHRNHITKKFVAFDAKSQYVSNTGAHKFVAPDFQAGDLRGPCPGLNAAANHGYLPHSGIGTIVDFINGTSAAFGMSLDLSLLLAVYGSVIDGNALGFSMGGTTPLLQLPLNNLLGITGRPQGLSGSHNKFETDTSPTRGDLYTSGNAYKLQVSQFQQYYDSLMENVSSDVQYDNLIDYRISRFDQSIRNNPYFFYSPFSGIIVSPAGFAFPVRMMANHSSEYPSGSLTREQLKTFFAITGSSGSFSYTEGHERIPDNWYKRAVGDDYTLVGFLLDLLNHGAKYPPFLSIGGNTGKKDSFTGVELGRLTKGLYDESTLADGDNLLCFLRQAAMVATPDVVAGMGSALESVLQPLLSGHILRGIACPQFDGFNDSQFSQFPGYQMCQNGCNGY